MVIVVGTCVKCGTEILHGEKRCPKCFTVMSRQNINMNKRPLWMSVLLAVAITILIVNIILAVVTLPMFPVEQCTNILGIKIGCHTQWVTLVHFLPVMQVAAEAFKGEDLVKLQINGLVQCLLL